MTKFEQWFSAQDFYTEMRFIHGDRLFDRDGDVYRVLPVQMTWVAWGKKPELGKPFDFDLLDSYKENIANKMKQIDRTLLMIECFWDNQKHKPTSREYANFIADIEYDLKALRGDQ